MPPTYTLSAHALCTVDDAKEWLGFTDATHDNFLTLLINSATGQIEEHCHRRLKSRAYVNDLTSFNGDGTIDGVIYLREFPVASVQQVILDEAVVDAASYDVDPSGYIRLIWEPSPAEIARTTGSQVIRVDYTAGFTPVPGDLVLACMEHVAHLFNRSPRGNVARAGITARSSGSTSETFVTDTMFPQSVKDVLVPYVRNEWIPHRVSA